MRVPNGKRASPLASRRISKPWLGTRGPQGVSACIADNQLRAQQSQNIQQLLHAYRSRGPLDIGDTGLPDAQALGELCLGQVAGLAQRFQQVL